jgi:hypothetical protein
MTHASHAMTVAEAARPLDRARAAAVTRGSLLLALAGALMAGGHAAMAPDRWRRLALAYLVAFAFVLSLSLGGLFFVFIQHLTRAGWSVVVRRPAEAMAASMPVVALLFLPVAAVIAWGDGGVYPWAVWHPSPAVHVADPHAAEPSHQAVDAHHGEPPSQGLSHQQLDDRTLAKRPWLNPAFFLLRWAVMLALWSGLGCWFWNQSRRQDSDADTSRTSRCEAIAAPAALLFAITLTLAAWDLLMSVNPHWYSSAFGVYYFSGAVVGTLAALILLTLLLSWRGGLGSAVGVEHLHDLGKLTFAFVFFWAYIGYSQYMLLWYAHLPETAGWLVHRGASTDSPNGWSPLLIVLVLGHFALPFAGLMSRHVKRRRFCLGAWAVWLLIMHWLDLVWLVMPESGPALALGGMEVGLLMLTLGVYGAGLSRRLKQAALAPVGDPRLHDSLAFENV